MSSVDPFAALFTQNAAEAALADLALGIPAELLQIQVEIGDMLAATVLPPQDGHDLLQILGKKIVAELPPALRPGDTLLLEVTGTSGNRVLVANLGALDPQQPLPPTVLQSPPTSPEPTKTGPPELAKTTPPLAPPRSVFVAASVTRSPNAPLQPQHNIVDAQPKPAGVEARIAATRAASAEAPPKPPAAVPVPVFARGTTAPAQRAQTQTGAVIPERLLQTLRVPVTATTTAAARIASDAIRRLPEVLTRLEQALTAVTNDARAATLRTIAAFVSRIDPSNEATLPQQIASYVSHVAEGPERKLADLLRATVGGDDARPAPPVAAEAKTVERAAALDHNVKALVLSILRQPPLEHTPQLAQALRDAVITLTGAQLQHLQSNTQNASALSLALPVFFKEDGRPAQLRIGRNDAQHSRAALDGDNFHVAFVLDTAALGTVAIDLQASGRSVSVNVRTETAREVPAFKATLADLAGRLQRLRYRVARTSAEVAPRATVPTKPAATARDRGLDLRA